MGEKETMHILMISDVYFPRVNGVSTSIMTYTQALRNLGHKVTIIAPEYSKRTQDEQDIIRIPSRHLIIEDEDRMMKSKYIYKLVDQLASLDIDLIHIQTPFVAHYVGVKLSNMLDVPRVESYHTFFEEYLYHYVPFMPKSFMKSIARRFSVSQCNDVDAIVVPSTAMLETLREYGVTAEAEIIPTGIDLSQFSAGDGDSFCKKHGIDKNRPRLVHIGRVAHEKNIDFILSMLVEVKKTVPNVLLIIAGEGPAVKHLRSLSQQKGLVDNVKFIGYLDRNTELKDCYCAGHAFVFASRTETQGLVLLEAMALGVPVVSTAVMGTRDILEEEMGAIVAEEDIEDFSQKVIGVLQDVELRQLLSTEAMVYSKKWSEDRFARRMCKFYQRTIEEYSSLTSPDTVAGEAVD